MVVCSLLGGVLAASRESEQYHVRRRAHVHDILQSKVTRDEVPSLPLLCPFFISWRETVVSASADAWEGGGMRVSHPEHSVLHHGGPPA